MFFFIFYFQVIGNKWDTYLDLLQADYTEGWAPSSFCYQITWISSYSYWILLVPHPLFMNIISFMKTDASVFFWLLDFIQRKCSICGLGESFLECAVNPVMIFANLWPGEKSCPPPKKKKWRRGKWFIRMEILYGRFVSLMVSEFLVNFVLS